MNAQETSTTTLDPPLITRAGRAFHRSAASFAAGLGDATISMVVSDLERYRVRSLPDQPQSLPTAGPPNPGEHPMTERMPEGPGPLIDFPDGYFRPIPKDFDGPLERSDIPFTYRAYDRSGSIIGEVERLRDDGVLVIRPRHGEGKVSRLYALFTSRRYVPVADA
jgi:hypothetical protein